MVAVAAGIALSALLPLRATDAAFTGSTSTSGSFTAGSVTLSDDTSGSALVSTSGLLPGDVVRDLGIVLAFAVAALAAGAATLRRRTA